MLWNGILWGIKALHGGNENFSENLSNYRQCFWKMSQYQSRFESVSIEWYFKSCCWGMKRNIYCSIEWERRVVGKQLAKRAILHHLYENRVSVTQIYWSQWTPCCSKILSIIQLITTYELKMLSQKMSSYKEKISRKRIALPGFTVENTNSPLHCSETTYKPF